MQQTSLFHDSIHDALASDVAALNGVKHVGGLLWPTLDTSVAAAKLRSCLNPDQAQKLSADEVMTIKRMARDAGSFATVSYEAQILGYRVEWITPEEEAEQTRREIADGMKTLTKMFERLQRAEQRGSLKSVK